MCESERVETVTDSGLSGVRFYILMCGSFEKMTYNRIDVVCQIDIKEGPTTSAYVFQLNVSTQLYEFYFSGHVILA